ncbi:hypothetical protein M0R45_019177 [Rubus argutus]|uniref:Uncharacterized protein n=1 Tax=Rubus argutus TaxID=59490 RepID=A0AAW1X6H8_RUBAR
MGFTAWVWVEHGFDGRIGGAAGLGGDARLGGNAVLELGSRAAGGIDGDLSVVAGLEDAVDGDNACCACRILGRVGLAERKIGFGLKMVRW